jgi:hypothetical protein
MGIPIGADTSEADYPGEFRTTQSVALSLIGIGSKRYEIPDSVILGG